MKCRALTRVSGGRAHITATPRDLDADQASLGHHSCLIECGHDSDRLYNFSLTLGALSLLTFHCVIDHVVECVLRPCFIIFDSPQMLPVLPECPALHSGPPMFLFCFSVLLSRRMEHSSSILVPQIIDRYHHDHVGGPCCSELNSCYLTQHSSPLPLLVCLLHRGHIHWFLTVAGALSFDAARLMTDPKSNLDDLLELPSAGLVGSQSSIPRRHKA
jgi:hypothetical protein